MESSASGSPKAQSNTAGSQQFNRLFRKPNLVVSKEQNSTNFIINEQHIGTLETALIPALSPMHEPEENSITDSAIEAMETREMPSLTTIDRAAFRTTAITPQASRTTISKSKAALLIALLVVIVIQTFNIGPTYFLGKQGWAYVLGGPQNLHSTFKIATTDQLPGSNNSHTKGTISPQKYIDQIISKMTIDQKIGQMMMVQFVGPDYSLALNTMVTQYYVGSALIFKANTNIVSKEQLTQLTQQIQQNSPQVTFNNGAVLLPATIAIDQEGGNVDRLRDLDGPRPAAASISDTNDPAKAREAGQKDAQDLSRYGINLNLAPVVDIDNSNISEIHRDLRAFGQDADTVTKMAGAYLQGLQKSGKVIGTLKHFPGLGYTNTDPHFGLPLLNRTEGELMNIDWAPYRSLIQRHLARAIMVTHEIVPTIDDSKPSSLSVKVVQNILRDKLGFQGVIMTDSLTMQGITNQYTPGMAAELAVAAGSDIIMGANSPEDVSTMVDGIKQGLSDGSISQARINESVHRILMMKYQIGLLPLP